MSCTKQEIEQKRLAALQKRQNRLSSPLKTCNTLSLSGASNFGPLKTNHGSTKGFHPYATPQPGTSYGSSAPPIKVVSGSIYLISEDRFEVNPSEFCTPLINIFKTLTSRSYDSSSKLWNFSTKDYDELMSKVAPLAPDIVLGPLPDNVLKILKEPKIDPSSIDLSPIETTLRHKLMPFQEEGVRFGISKQGRCLIADDMGLGKTYQALAIASYYRKDWPLLIVTTSSMRETWQTHIRDLLPSVPLLAAVSVAAARDAAAAADASAVVCSYKMAATLAPMLERKRFGVVIIDESHYLKSHKAQCTVALTRVCRAARRAVLLSGTPALSRPAELFAQLRLVRPALFTSYTDYGKRYCAAKQTRFGWDMSGRSHAAELRAVLRALAVRRARDRVLRLGDKTREAVYLDESLLQWDGGGGGGGGGRPAGGDRAALLAYFSQTARAKAPAVCAYLRALLPTLECKMLVFAHHRCVLRALSAELDAAGARHVVIDGGTPASARAELVSKFQLCESVRAAVLSTPAAHCGLTLTAAGLVVFAELHWNPGILSQAESRAHRLGRRGPVACRYLLARGTCDDVMWPMIQGKLDVLNEMGLSTDSFENTTSSHQGRKEIENITKYLSPVRNKNDYIPGTNIRINETRDNASIEAKKYDVDLLEGLEEEFDENFLNDSEGDELLANLEL